MKTPTIEEFIANPCADEPRIKDCDGDVFEKNTKARDVLHRLFPKSVKAVYTCNKYCDGSDHVRKDKKGVYIDYPIYILNSDNRVVLLWASDFSAGICLVDGCCK